MVFVADCRSVLVTTISTNPAAWAAVTQVMEVDETIDTDVAATPPKVTEALLKKPVPIIVTEVPPSDVPVVGEREVI